MKNLPMKQPDIPDRALETVLLYTNELLEILDMAGDIRETEVLSSMEEDIPENLLQELDAELVGLRSRLLEIILTVATSVSVPDTPDKIREFVHSQMDELHLNMMLDDNEKPEK